MKHSNIGIGLAVLLAAGCSSQAKEAAGDVVSKSPAEMSGSPTSAPRARLASQEAPAAAPKEVPIRRVIRNGSLTVRVNNVEKAEQKVSDLVAQEGGYVESAQSSDLASATPTLDLKLRIPAESFEKVMAGLEKLGVRLAKTVKSEDVTASIVDMAARLKIMKAQEEVYRNMLAKSSNSQQMIDVQDKLMTLRGSIESLESQHATLSRLAALSAIDLILRQGAEGTVAATADPNWAREAWGGALGTLGNVARVGGSGLIWFLVFAPIWLPTILLLRAFWRRAQPAPGPKFDLPA